MAEFLHVFIDPKAGVDRKQVEEKLNSAVDWYRYTPKAYILYTTSSPETWYHRLMPLVVENGSLFICRFDISSRYGWMTKGFWKWVRREKYK